MADLAVAVLEPDVELNFDVLASETTELSPAPVAAAWTEGVSRARATALLVAMCVSTFLFVTIEGLPYGLLRFISTDLAVTDSQVGLLVSGYALLVFAMSVPLAALSKRFPRKWVLAVVVALAALATLGTGFATGYVMVLATRLVTALAQALFWVAVLPGTAGLYPANVRGRILARLALGNAFAPVIGLPAAAWLANQFGWRLAFWVACGLSLVVFALILVLFPNVPSDEVGATPAPFGSRRRFWFLLVQTALLVAGAFGVITFIAPFLLDVAGYAQHQTAWLLAVYGIGGLAGALAIARLLDRSPWGAMVAGASGLVVVLLALWAFGATPLAAIGLLVVFAFAWAGMAPTLTQRAMLCSPFSTDVGVAAQSGVYNLGIASGSALGAALVAGLGVHVVPLVGAFLMAAVVVLALVERRVCGPEPVSQGELAK